MTIHCLLFFSIAASTKPCFPVASGITATCTSAAAISSSGRRSALCKILGGLRIATNVHAPPAWASIEQPTPDAIVTLVLSSPNDKAGVQLADAKLAGGSTVPYVKSLAPDGIAATQGLKEGMVVLQGKSSAGIVQRLQSGPYPLVLQFYNLGAEATPPSSPMDGLQRAAQKAPEPVKDPPLSSRGAGLITKTISKGQDCARQARRGDQVSISYQARVASPGGPLYDSSADRPAGKVSFQLGDGQAIPGVDIGIGGMCKGEVRTIDIPPALGYGRGGSTVFDLPGDVRLWWRVELLELVEGQKNFPFR